MDEENDPCYYHNYLVTNQNINFQNQGRGFQQNYPSGKKLKTLADDILSKIGRRNNDEEFYGEIHHDTISVARTNKDELIIAGNLKERRKTDSLDKTQYIQIKIEKKYGGGKKKLNYKNYGIDQKITENIVHLVKICEIYRNSNLNVKIIEEKVNPLRNDALPKMMDKARDHAKKHSEMKTRAHCEKERKSMKAIGISKPACKDCYEVLSNEQTNIFPGEAGQNKVTSWSEVDEDDVMVIHEIIRNKEVECGMSMYSSNVEFNKDSLKGAVKDNFNIKRCMKPGGSVGIISGILDLKGIIDTNNTKSYATSDVITTKTGVTENILGVGKMAYASASVVEVSAGFGGLVGVSALALSASAHAGYGLNNSVGAGLSFVRAQTNVGPAVVMVGVCLDTEAHVGVNGIGASVLGFGFNIGPSIRIKTPFVDFGLNLL